jgi:hypothetical protein
VATLVRQERQPTPGSVVLLPSRGWLRVVAQGLVLMRGENANI